MMTRVSPNKRAARAAKRPKTGTPPPPPPLPPLPPLSPQPSPANNGVGVGLEDIPWGDPLGHVKIRLSPYPVQCCFHMHPGAVEKGEWDALLVRGAPIRVGQAVSMRRDSSGGVTIALAGGGAQVEFVVPRAAAARWAAGAPGPLDAVATTSTWTLVHAGVGPAEWGSLAAGAAPRSPPPRLSPPPAAPAAEGRSPFEGAPPATPWGVVALGDGSRIARGPDDTTRFTVHAGCACATLTLPRREYARDVAPLVRCALETAGAAGVLMTDA